MRNERVNHIWGRKFWEHTMSCLLGMVQNGRTIKLGGCLLLYFVTWFILVCLSDYEDLVHTWRMHLLTLILWLLYLSALLDDVMDSYATSCGILPFLFWVYYDYWYLCRSLLFFHLVYSSMSCRRRRFVPYMTQAFIILLKNLLLAIPRRYRTMLWTLTVPASGISPSLFWVDYYYWDLYRSLQYILGKWRSSVLVLRSLSPEGSW